MRKTYPAARERPLPTQTCGMTMAGHHARRFQNSATRWSVLKPGKKGKGLTQTPQPGIQSEHRASAPWGNNGPRQSRNNRPSGLLLGTEPGFPRGFWEKQCPSVRAGTREKVQSHPGSNKGQVKAPVQPQCRPDDFRGTPMRTGTQKIGKHSISVLTTN